jgi:hypothetical protein
MATSEFFEYMPERLAEGALALGECLPMIPARNSTAS